MRSRRDLPPCLLAAALALGCASAAPARTTPPAGNAAAPAEPRPAPEREGWELAWHDEFDGPGIDRTKWTFDQGGLWRNGEQQFYTDRPANARVEGGRLIVEARREDFFGNDFTSARLKTHGLASFLYGRIEARMQVPAGQGLWPAFWMLGDGFPKVNWPGCGEIDVVEVIGREPSVAHATAHGARFHGGAGLTRAYTYPGGALADAEHVFAVEWEPGVIRWYLDDVLYHTITPADLPDPAGWPFDKPFFLIVNLAVGGAWPGDPDATTSFPAQLRVDYVRVYRRSP